MTVEHQAYSLTVENTPPYLETEEKNRLLRQAVENLGLVERDALGRDMVKVKTNYEGPVKVIQWGDLHLGSTVTDLDTILELRDQILAEPGTFVVFAGDEIEGLTAKYLNTNIATTPIDVQAQMDWFRTEILELLDKEGRVLAMVTDYWGHLGWASDSSTINTWKEMTKGLVSLVGNGGIVELETGDSRHLRYRIWHNPPGKSRFDPVYGLRQEALETTAELRPDVFGAGHLHRAGIAQEHLFGAGRYSEPTTFVASATNKGSSETKARDRLGIKLGKNRADPGGQGVCSLSKHAEEVTKVYPFISPSHGQVIHRAVDLFERVESQGITKELLGEIRNNPNLQATIARRPDGFVLSDDVYNEHRPQAESHKLGVIDSAYFPNGLSPQYSQIAYEILHTLPLLFLGISNIRHGADTASGIEEFRRFQQEYIVPDSHVFPFFLRSLVDSSTADSCNRRQILNDCLGLLTAQKTERVLALLLDKNLHNPKWKRPIIIRRRPLEIESPVAAATYLSRKTANLQDGFSGVPLIHSQGRIVVTSRTAVGNKDISFTVIDRQMRHGSYYRSSQGNNRIYDLYMNQKSAVTIGGHMPGAGFSQRFHRGNIETRFPVAVAPGWWAKSADTMGQGNVMPGAIPGQGVIFVPHDGPEGFLLFPTSSASQTVELFRAVTLLTGLKHLDLIEAVYGRTR
ncbi:hypothetical protein DRH14_00340 [Candidatus Shapirobacteria bacterium]|nr:MAG: hypothetical protein DRH14_00340 [Candidatus Shapirobacteria bacterium]